MSVKFHKEGLCGSPTIAVACIHTKMGKGGFWAMSLSNAKTLHRQLGKAIERASKTVRAKRPAQQAKGKITFDDSNISGGIQM
jgi:hypothetical protein